MNWVPPVQHADMGGGENLLYAVYPLADVCNTFFNDISAAKLSAAFPEDFPESRYSIPDGDAWSGTRIKSD